MHWMNRSRQKSQFDLNWIKMDTNLNKTSLNSWMNQSDIELSQNRFNAGKNCNESDTFWDNRAGRSSSSVSIDSNFYRPNSAGSSEMRAQCSVNNKDSGVSFLDFVGKKTQVAPAIPQSEENSLLQALALLKSQSIFSGVLNQIEQDSSLLNRTDINGSSSNSPHTFTGSRLDLQDGYCHLGNLLTNVSSSHFVLKIAATQDLCTKRTLNEVDRSEASRMYSSARVRRGSGSPMDISPDEDNASPRITSPNDRRTDRRKRSKDRQQSRVETKRSRRNDSPSVSSRSKQEESRKPTQKDTRLAWNYISVGNIKTGVSILNQQIGLVNVEPYRKFMSRAMLKSNIVISTIPEFPSLTQRIGRRYENEDNLGVRIDAAVIERQLERAYKSASCAKFEKAIKKFRDILLWITLTVVESEKEELDIKGSVQTCRAYILALEMDLKRRSIVFDTVENKQKICELTAYVADCDLLPIHRQITFRVALTFAYKFGNYKMAANFCKKLLELEPKPEVVNVAEFILEQCNSKLEDEHKVNYEEGKLYSVCAFSHVPIYEGDLKVCCPYCGASYLPLYKGSVCIICNLCQIGLKASGLSVLRVM
ncbi:hypothetical protein CHUAL_005571 [Chamberlinius hualienensis]